MPPAQVQLEYWLCTAVSNATQAVSVFVRRQSLTPFTICTKAFHASLPVGVGLIPQRRFNYIKYRKASDLFLLPFRVVHAPETALLIIICYCAHQGEVVVSG